MENEHGAHQEGGQETGENRGIERKTTVGRIFLTIVYLIFYCIAETIVWFIIGIQLLIALIVKKPNPFLADFANKTIVYLYRILRYLCYVEKKQPFPFSEYPKVLEELEQ